MQKEHRPALNFKRIHMRRQLKTTHPPKMISKIRKHRISGRPSQTGGKGTGENEDTLDILFCSFRIIQEAKGRFCKIMAPRHGSMFVKWFDGAHWSFFLKAFIPQLEHRESISLQTFARPASYCFPLPPETLDTRHCFITSLVLLFYTCNLAHPVHLQPLEPVKLSHQYLLPARDSHTPFPL